MYVIDGDLYRSNSRWLFPQCISFYDEGIQLVEHKVSKFQTVKSFDPDFIMTSKVTATSRGTVEKIVALN